MNDKFDEMHALCSELPLLQERIFRAGLLKTGQALNTAVQAIGFEVAEHIEKAQREG